MTDIYTLLSNVLGGAPSLPGARCRGKAHLFDEAGPNETVETTTARHHQALGLCPACPALTACTTWLDSLPPGNRPPGVIAATLTPLRKERTS